MHGHRTKRVGLRAEIAQKIRGNHSLRKQNPHQRASYWLGREKVNDFTTLVHRLIASGRG
jgi:hypothetical protein